MVTDRGEVSQLHYHVRPPVSPSLPGGNAEVISILGGREWLDEAASSRANSLSILRKAD